MLTINEAIQALQKVAAESPNRGGTVVCLSVPEVGYGYTAVDAITHDEGIALVKLEPATEARLVLESI